MKIARREPTPNLSEYLYSFQILPRPEDLRSRGTAAYRNWPQPHNWESFAGPVAPLHGHLPGCSLHNRGPWLPAGPPNLHEGSQCLLRGASFQPALVAEKSQVLGPHYPRLANPGHRHKVGWGVGGTTLGPGLGETACSIAADQASLPLPSNPNSRARAAAPTRAIQTGEGRNSRPRASEKRALCISGGLDSKESHSPVVSLKNRSLPYTNFPPPCRTYPNLPPTVSPFWGAQLSPLPQGSPRIE